MPKEAIWAAAAAAVAAVALVVSFGLVWQETALWILEKVWRLVKPVSGPAVGAVAGVTALVLLGAVRPWIDRRDGPLLEGALKAKLLLLSLGVGASFFYLDLGTDALALQAFWQAKRLHYFALNLMGIVLAAAYYAQLVFKSVGGEFRRELATAAALQLLPLGCLLNGARLLCGATTEAEFKQRMQSSGLLAMESCPSMAESLIKALLSAVTQAYSYIHDSWPESEKAILRTSILISVLSLTKGFAELDQRRQVLRSVDARPFVMGTAPRTHLAFWAAALYRGMAVTGRLLLAPFFHHLTRDVLAVPWRVGGHVGCGAPLLMGLDLAVQLALVRHTTGKNHSKYGWAVANTISPAEPLLHGGAPILSTDPDLASLVHLVEAAVATVVVLCLHGGPRQVLGQIGNPTDRVLLCMCAACCALQFHTLMALRILCAYPCPQEDTWEAVLAGQECNDLGLDQADRAAPVAFFISGLPSSQWEHKNQFKKLMMNHSSQTEASIVLGDPYLAIAFAVALRRSTVVKEVKVFISHDMRVSTAKAFAAVFMRNNTIQTITLTQAGPGDIETTTLADMLKANRSLTDISFERTEVKAFANALKTNPTAEKIGFTSCHIGAGGAEAIAAMLSENTSAVKVLDLTRTPLGDDGLAALETALKQNATLEMICLQTCGIGERGAEALARMLSKLCSLKMIVLNSNKIGDRGAEALATALAGQTTVETVSLCGCRIGDPGLKAIADMLTKNDAVKLLLTENDGMRLVNLAGNSDFCMNIIDLERHRPGGQLLRVVQVANKA